MKTYRVQWQTLCSKGGGAKITERVRLWKFTSTIKRCLVPSGTCHSERKMNGFFLHTSFLCVLYRIQHLLPCQVDRLWGFFGGKKLYGDSWFALNEQEVWKQDIKIPRIRYQLPQLLRILLNTKSNLMLCPLPDSAQMRRGGVWKQSSKEHDHSITCQMSPPQTWWTEVLYKVHLKKYQREKAR